MQLLMFLLACLFVFSNKVFATDLIKGMTATASTTETNSSPNNAVDGNSQTFWRANGSANTEVGSREWLLLDLGGVKTVNKIILKISQENLTPIINNHTIHDIEIGLTTTKLRKVISVNQITQNHQTISIPLLKPEENIRYIKITTRRKMDKVAWEEIEVYEGKSKAESKLKYFGYLSSEGSNNVFARPMSEQYLNELDEMANTNIAWVPGNPTDLRKFTDHNIKAIIRGPITDIFFGKGKANWEKNWAEFVNMLNSQPIDVRKNIYGFEIDEPIGHKYPIAEFRNAARMIRQSFPNKKMFVIENATSYKLSKLKDVGYAGADDDISAQKKFLEKYFENVTDFAIDHYFTRLMAPLDTGWRETILKPFEEFRNVIEGKDINGENRLFWAIFDAQVDTQAFFDINPNPTPDELDAEIKRQIGRWGETFNLYLAQVMSMPNAVGMLGFQWNHRPEDEITTKTGTTSASEVFVAGRKYFNVLLRNSQRSTGKLIITTGDFNNDNKVDLMDFGVWKEKYLQTPPKTSLFEFGVWRREFLQ